MNKSTVTGRFCHRRHMSRRSGTSRVGAGAIEIQIRVGNINKPSLGSLASRRKIPRVLRLLARLVNFVCPIHCTCPDCDG